MGRRALWRSLTPLALGIAATIVFAVYPFSMLPSGFAEPARSQLLWLQMGPAAVTLLASVVGSFGLLDRYIAGGALLAVAVLTGWSVVWWQIINLRLTLQAPAAVLAACAGVGLIVLLRPAPATDPS